MKRIERANSAQLKKHMNAIKAKKKCKWMKKRTQAKNKNKKIYIMA